MSEHLKSFDTRRSAPIDANDWVLMVFYNHYLAEERHAQQASQQQQFSMQSTLIWGMSHSES